ncbi:MULTISPECIES: hypothetical protein [unclassified Streptomyces]|uniref:hypothetical protein n=1 Tax=unclassified Streptomyces TaxID=2593676 RepID=UPI001BE81D5D|nr:MULTISPECIES: hypothetical protein [unclassified Streptomyces]MBT2406864.1 hypothetical protein [Streptomyces sp. ISL-21]MBT2612959.1 hypothetical protein [Streptomyces sp. ISL-87]
MSLTDFRTARREDDAAKAEQSRLNEELHADLHFRAQQQAFEQERARAADEQEAKDREAERIRKAKEAEAAAKLAKEQSDRAAKAAADEKKRRDKAKQRREARERFAARLNAAPAWLAEHLDLAAALAVMACSIVPALISQAASLTGTGILGEMGWVGYLLVTLLPVMLECSAWAATAGEAKAMQQGRSPWPYRIAIYTFAGLAAWINWLHGQQVGGDKYGTILGAVLAASSIIPIAVWQLVQLGRHQEARARLKAERARRKAVKATRKQREDLLPTVWATAKTLRAIAGHELLSEDEAWHAAYGVHEGTGVDLPEELLRHLSAEMLGLRVDAEGRLAEVLEELADARRMRLTASAKVSAVAAENVSDESVKPVTEEPATLPTRVFAGTRDGLVEGPANAFRWNGSSQVNPSVPPSARTPAKTPTRKREAAAEGSKRPSVTAPVRRLSRGARRAAAETAKNYDATENAAIEEWIRSEIRDGRIPTAKGVTAETKLRRAEVHGDKAIEPGKSWVYDRLAKAKSTRSNPAGVRSR